MGDLTVLRGIPRKFRPLTGRGRLPDLENLLDRNVDDLVRILNRFGLDPDMAAIEARANQAFRWLEEVIAEGREPDEATWEAIDKQIQNEVAATLRQQVKAAIRNYQMYRLEQTGASQFIWVTVGDQNVCKSCEPRHGKIKKLLQWDKLGPPGSSTLVCKQECRCVLQPLFDD